MRLEKERTDQANQELNQLVTRLEIEKASSLFEQGQSAPAIAWLAKLLRAEPENKAVAQRALSALDERVFAHHITTVQPASSTMAVELSDDGALMALATTDGAVQVFRAATGEPLTSRLMHDATAYPLDFTKDGALLVSGGFDNAARLWDARRGAPRGAPMRHGRRTPCGRPSVRATIGSSPAPKIAPPAFGPRRTPGRRRRRSRMKSLCIWPRFGPDQSKLVTGTPNGRLTVWRASDWSQEAGMGGACRLFSTDFKISPDGRWLISYGDETASLWNMEDGGARGAPLTHGSPIRAASFRRDSNEVVTSSLDNDVRIWRRSENGFVFKHLRSRIRGFDGVFHYANDQIWSLENRDLLAWDSENGRLVNGVLNQPQIKAFRIARDGRTVITWNRDHSVGVWRLERRRRPATTTVDTGALVTQAQPSPRGKWLGLAQGVRGARLWNASSLAPVGRIGEGKGRFCPARL